MRRTHTSDHTADMETPRRYAGATAEARKAERYDRLIEAAFDVYGREGVRKATMRLICAQARLTERYFYEHFANLDEVFVAVHQRTSTQAGLAVMTATQAASGDPQAQTRAGLHAFFEFIKSDSRRGQILLLDAASQGMTTPNHLNKQLSLFAQMVDMRIRSKYPHLNIDAVPDLIVAGISGLIIHTATMWMSRGFDWPVDTMVDHTAYAWIGLHRWLEAHNAAPATVLAVTPGSPSQRA